MSDLAKTLLLADANGHDELAEMLERGDDPFDLAAAHREAAEWLRRALGAVGSEGR